MSVTPAGGATLAVFDSVPVAVEAMLAVSVYVTVLPAGKSTSLSSMLPLPLAVKPLAPPVAMAVNVAPAEQTRQGVDQPRPLSRRWARRC